MGHGGRMQARGGVNVRGRTRVGGAKERNGRMGLKDLTRREARPRWRNEGMGGEGLDAGEGRAKGRSGASAEKLPGAGLMWGAGQGRAERHENCGGGAGWRGAR